ncbi:MAG: site-2 protease family protein [Rhodospirillaceae bacterium]|jgi:Zn-dependent protease|nr:site-2 protease family protein [Rhodospirillaceae bacterium]MBT4937681.1 site-2 protease family protein [Rhodospirillaceae bacterium]MBT7265745.1 site-2 protease family protein [Rhodospirillaceae bacterium]
MDEQSLLFKISTWVLPIVLAVTFHEASHGWVAWKLGDDTAFNEGRITFNPIKHIDPFGTVILPALLLLATGGKMSFGYAKPVPVNFWALNKPRRDMVLVALAGPGSNLILAILSAALFHVVELVPRDIQPWLAANLMMSILFNLILCIFNMIPIPPLDGGRVAVGILPPHLAQQLARLERAGFGIILGALFVLPWLGDLIGLDLNIFMWIVGIPAFELAGFIINMVGVY